MGSRRYSWLVVLALLTPQAAWARKPTTVTQRCVTLEASAHDGSWHLRAKKLTRDQSGVTVWLKDVTTSETVEIFENVTTDASGSLALDMHAALSCGHTYQGVVFDPGVGTYDYSNSYTENC